MSSGGGSGGLMRVENRAKSTTSLCGFGSCKWRQLLSIKALALLLLIIGGVVVYYLIDAQNEESAFYSPLQSSSPRFTLAEMREFAFKNSMSTDYKGSFYNRRNLSFNKMLEDNQYRFNVFGKDVLVFLHIQKTAGTSFERFLVNKLNVARPCSCRVGKKRCNCYRPHSQNEVWLFSRYSTGWVCGLHADYTELFVSGCVDNALDKKEGVHTKRRYFYTTFLRDPVARFISEYRHVHRGATWLAARHMCNGRQPSPEELPMCFDPEIGWDGLSLDEFLSCPYNLAFNRQTRMLADLTLVNCYNTKGMDAATRDKVMLESAKTNLKNMAFFGIKERMEESQWMFETVFQARFAGSLNEWNKSKSHDTPVTTEQLQLIKQLNHLDIELYKYAMKLFDRRLRKLKDDDYSHPGVKGAVKKISAVVSLTTKRTLNGKTTTIHPTIEAKVTSNSSLYEDPDDYDSDEEDAEEEDDPAGDSV
ncbi:hypothetical protein QR680_000631 [Steinernema hermaphroditum]|uniref:Heparan-sulfate 6-O-sulfotransferase n=1 Tax=Steinernema hermaphroditum TaxID=289476 RepID=A0AA39GVA6_9BILA|nr:hypothetical protein QR680_000631 [Steinernema hermaphroditum]